jgi:hypothetical protein
LRFVDPTGMDYMVHVTGGRDFSFPGSWSEFQGFAAGFTLDGSEFSGVIYNAAGQAVGTYEYYQKSAYERMLADVAMRAGPPVDLVVRALRLFGYAVAPALMTAADCAANPGGCGIGVGLAMLPWGSVLKGASLARAGRGSSAAAIYEKAGGSAQATVDFKALAGAERTVGNVAVKELPGGSKDVLRNFSTDGRATLEIQHASGQVTKVRYNQ